MFETEPIESFLKAPGVILDVRTPAEYMQGSIPGAINFPLFSNSERVIIGTTYKKQGKNSAIELGLKFVGPKLSDMAIAAQEYATNGYLRVHCWRGGMRSSSVVWLLRTLGIKVVTLNGGYKAYRRWALSLFQRKFIFSVLGGFTGSGKTTILSDLEATGEQVLDLEALASHRGSSYGMIGMAEQPTTEQFENDIAMRLHQFDANQPIWVEDESHLIGRCRIPEAIFAQMQSAPLFLIERTVEERVEILLKDYGKADAKDLIASTQRLEKRLGMVRAKEIISHITENRLVDALKLILEYYDQAYLHSLQRRKKVHVHH